MKIGQAIKMSIKSIFSKKGRSFLTMLGIIIGIASVMLIVSVVNGMNEITMKRFEAMGTNMVSVSASRYDGANMFDSLYNFSNSLGDLTLGVTPSARFDVNVAYGSKSTNKMEENDRYGRYYGYDDGEEATATPDAPPELYFGSDQYAVCNNFKLATGRDISQLDIKNYNQVCVLGARAAQTFFNYADPVGQEMLVGGMPYEVIGVYAEKDPDSNPRWCMDNIMVFPYSTSRTLAPGTSMDEFMIKASSADATTEVISRVTGYLSGQINDENGYFYVDSNNEWQKSSNESATMASLVLGGIAFISLLVGGIGIMNIMLVTVTERTREIGIRRAIGAERSSIVVQFLIEAAMICGIGGLIGIALGTVGTLIAGKLLLQVIIWPALWITGSAFGLSVALGILFGIYPAAKASKLQPVEALRAE